MNHFNGLTPAEAERLALLLEEMGEAQQAIGKILRHGYESRHPSGGPTNRENLEREIADVRAIIELMIRAEDIEQLVIDQFVVNKAEKVKPYLHHQPA